MQSFDSIQNGTARRETLLNVSSQRNGSLGQGRIQKEIRKMYWSQNNVKTFLKPNKDPVAKEVNNKE